VWFFFAFRTLALCDSFDGQAQGLDFVVEVQVEARWVVVWMGEGVEEVLTDTVCKYLRRQRGRTPA